MGRILKKQIVDAFLPIENTDEIIKMEGRSQTRANELWKQHRQETWKINREFRSTLSSALDSTLVKSESSNLQVIVESKNLLTTKEVAALIGKSEGSVRNFVCDGRLRPVCKKWNTNYFDKNEVLQTIMAATKGGS
ncbi:MAG: helix-turn-helix domain-containing protein [Patescibacteria group bacterium]